MRAQETHSFVHETKPEPAPEEEIDDTIEEENDEEDTEEIKVKSLDREEIKNSFFQNIPIKENKKETTISKDISEGGKSEEVVSETEVKKFDHLLNLFLWIVCGLLFATLIYINFDEIKSVFVREETKNSDTAKVTINKPNLEVYTGTVATGTAATTGTTGITAATGSTATTGVTTEPIATTIDKKAIKMNVLNGNGISNSAVLVKNILVKAGFTVSSVTNAKKFTYPTTIVYYKTGKEAEAELVKDALSTRSVTTELYDGIGSLDVQVVVGKK
ncbi:MAG: LytR C-terminal domain-containing protein [Candidatus Berkelbacteria bacterium]